MAQQKVELRKVRDFSDNLNDTFQFLKENFKPLLTYIFGIAGVFMLVAAILNGMYQSQTTGMFEDIFSGKRSTMETNEMFSSLYFVAILFVWLTAVALQVVVTGYLKVYDDNQTETPTFEQVWNVFKRHFILIAIYNIPLALLIIIGIMLCIAPGVYLMVVLAPFASIVIIENESFGGAFNRCFTLIKENFWLSLGIYIVVFLISIFSSGIIQLVVGVITGVITYFTTEDFKSTVAIVTSVLNVLGFIFYLFVFLSVTLNYYNLAERYDGTGILSRLEGLGTNTPPPAHHSNTEEEY